MVDGDRELLRLFTEEAAPSEVASFSVRNLGGIPAWEGEVLSDLSHALEGHLRNGEGLAVGTRLALFYDHRDRNRSLVPDLLIAKTESGVLPETYRLWEQTAPPAVIIEVTDGAGRIEDFGEKKGVYAAVGVPEFLLFDPKGDYLDPPLRLYRLEGDEYRRVDSEPLRIEGLDLELRLEGEDGRRLRFFDPKARALLPGRTETLGSVVSDSGEAYSCESPAEPSRVGLRGDELATELEELRRF